MDFLEQIERIKEKLLKAKNIDINLEVFGARVHKYYIGKPISNKEIEKFEKKCSLQLPECYKAFMLHIGNGGKIYEESAAGPYYGIYSFGMHIDEFVSKNTEEYLKKDCFITPDISKEEWEKIEQKIYNTTTSEDEYWEESEKLFSGILPIGSQGCNAFHGIILNGKYKGRILNIHVEVDISNPRFSIDANFLDWYERWLDEIILGSLIMNTNFCFGIDS